MLNYCEVVVVGLPGFGEEEYTMAARPDSFCPFPVPLISGFVTVVTGSGSLSK